MPMSLAALLALFPDNTSGQIGADDMRTTVTELYQQPANVPVGGTTGQVLAKASATDWDTGWVTPSTGGGGVTSVDGDAGPAVVLTDNYLQLLIPTAVKTGAYTAVARDLVLVDSTSGTITITLPTGQPDGTVIGVRMVTSTTPTVFAVNVVRSGTDVFNKPGGATAYGMVSLNQGVVFQYQSAGGVWHPIASAVSLNDLNRLYWNPSCNVTLNISSTASQDVFYPVDTTSSAITLTLPSAPPDGTMFACKLIAGANALTIARGGTDLIGKPTTGTTSKVLAGVGQTLLLTYSNATVSGNTTGVWYEITDVRNTVAAGSNITLDAPANGLVNVNVDPNSADLWMPKLVTSAADQTVTNTTALVDDTELQYAIPANQAYDIRGRVILLGTSTEKARARITGTGTLTGDWCWVAAPNTAWSSGSMGLSGNYSQTLSSTEQQIGLPATANPMMMVFEGTLLGGASGGTVKFQFAQQTAGATNLVRKANSRLLLRRLT